MVWPIGFPPATVFPWKGVEEFPRFPVRTHIPALWKGVNVERKANFGCGLGVELGDESGLGVGCVVPSDTRIGNYVMMGPNCRILHQNHNFGRTDIPMCHQGLGPKLPTVIEDDVWIGRDVLITPGRVIRKGSIVGCGCVLSKDFPEYSIIGGNPPRLIRSRLPG